MNKPNSINDWPEIKMYGGDFRHALHNLYIVIDEKELWDYIRENPPDPNKGYMFSDDNTISSIGNDQRINQDGHSGATFAYAMRVMQRISYVGFSKFCEEN